jgi:hypothetical protein
MFLTDAQHGAFSALLHWVIVLVDEEEAERRGGRYSRENPKERLLTQGSHVMKVDRQWRLKSPLNFRVIGGGSATKQDRERERE